MNQQISHPRVELLATASLLPNPRNARTHSDRQLRQIAASIEKFGWLVPVVVDEDLMIAAGPGPVHGRALAALLREGDVSIPGTVTTALLPLVAQLEYLDAEIKKSDAAIARLAKTDPVANALMSIPGIGPVTASALVASVGDPSSFSGPRQFAAFLGLVPRQNSSGGKPRLGRVSKMGNAYLRKLLVVGAHAVLYHRAQHTDPLRCWAQKLMETKPFKLVAVATANKLARIAFAVMTTGTSYRAAKA